MCRTFSLLYSFERHFHNLSSDPNEDCMKNLYLGKLTYKLTTFGLTKLLVFYFLESCLGYTISQGKLEDLVIIFLMSDAFLAVPLATQTMIITKRYIPRKLTYKVTTSRFIKLLECKLLGSCLDYTLAKGISFNYCVPRWDLSNSS